VGWDYSYDAALAALLLRAANALQRFSATDKNGVRAQLGRRFAATDVWQRR
jgi:hypothetical protein